MLKRSPLLFKTPVKSQCVVGMSRQNLEDHEVVISYSRLASFADGGGGAAAPAASAERDPGKHMHALVKSEE